jgi:hypothetical protein
MGERSIESLLENLAAQRNACIGMDLEGYPEVEQRLVKAKLESLERELLYTVARHVANIEKNIAMMKMSDEPSTDGSNTLKENRSGQ